MKPLDITLSKQQAIQLNHEISKIRRKVRYLERFDCEMVYRLGSKDNTKISKVRIKEDDRPQKRKDRLTGDLVDKANDIITYAQNGKILVLAKSGGVPLFDGISPKLKMNKNDRGYLIPRNTPVPKGIIIAKDIQVDRYGQFHYALQPAYDMTLKEFQKKLGSLKKYMRPV
ncbi:hypothetical protein MNBD_GAMMA09-1422 [hydrothermal vent metagenome]|uniref:Tse2 ADP-ribosyltransferase toxin domain-containing protein n=1 Tax=hydrothermal vent metagenome TaxID=652676 RepID=A0A3B0XF71_9ZZZZ